MKAIIKKYSCVERIFKKMFLLNLAYKLITAKSGNKNLSIYKRKDKTAFLFWQHFVLTFLTASRAGQKKWTKK